MTNEHTHAAFDKDYWDEHWTTINTAREAEEPHPYLEVETADLAPGTALDAGCGTGAEARWLAGHGWRVSAADISVSALAEAARREKVTSAALPIEWIEADLTHWEPSAAFDLVTTSYAHPDSGQHEFYRRISEWVALGGTLLIIGHLHGHSTSGHSTSGHSHSRHEHSGIGHSESAPVEEFPENAMTTLSGITGVLDSNSWQIVTAREAVREVPGSGDQSRTLNDVIVRAKRIR